MTTSTEPRRFAGEAHALLQMTSLRQVAADGPLVIVSADGVKLRDANGAEYIDAVDGLYNVNIGYGRAELADVAAETMRRISFGSSYFGRTTVEALELSEKLARITPPKINRFFMTVGGSDANDTAIKLLRHANIVSGKPEKMTVIGRRDGFHGMTLGGTTLTGVSSLRDHIGPLLPGVVHIGQPGPVGDNATAAQLEEKILELGPENVAAFLAEPVSMPAGVAFPPPDYWPSIREVCTRYDVKLIADEVITGFGRTGRMFGSELWEIDPDIILMSKGLTSGYAPLGAVGFSEDIYEQLLASDAGLPHGFTAAGHPVSCAVALANIDIIERESLVENAATVGQYLNERLHTLAANQESILRVRSVGMLAAFDFDGVKLTGDPEIGTKAGALVTAELQRDGVLVRPYANTIVLAPALITTRDDVDELLGRIDATLVRLQS